MEIKKISIIGMGYVGLPLARLFAQKYLVIGYDINAKRIWELQEGYDKTNEVTEDELNNVLLDNQYEDAGLVPTNIDSMIGDSDIFIITVPTPIDENNAPDLRPLIAATELVRDYLKVGSIVIYESTVYPTTTEEICVPILDSKACRYNVDFGVGFSPERINPSDKVHTVDKIVKVTSGSNEEYATIIDDLYNEILLNGTFKASSIKVAEASKIIENAQRDVNIAFINELAKIFNLMNINTNEVLEAAGSKWNFLNFKQGLVGGHCIGVDPFYLAKKALDFKYNPEIILASRRINDSMGKYIGNEIVRKLNENFIAPNMSKVLMLGFTFKENCPDIRNTKVIDIINELGDWGAEVDVYDSHANKKDVKEYYGIDLLDFNRIANSNTKYNAIVFAVAHDDIIKTFTDPNILDNIRNAFFSIVYDIKGIVSDSDILNLYQL